MRSRVLYVVSRFPRVTETFVVNEWLALSDRFDMRLAALRRGERGAADAVTERVLTRTWYPPRVSVAAFGAHAHWLRRAPRSYGSTLLALVRGLRDGPSGNRVRDAAKSLIAFHQGAALARYVESVGIDHVHAHFANHPATAAWVVHRLTKRPFTFTAHANDVYRAPALLATKTNDASFVVAISEYNARLLRSLVPRARVHVVHCGADTRRFAPRPPAPASPERTLILCVAGLQAKKGHAVLLRAFNRLAAERPALHLTLVGDGPERPAVEAAVTSLGIGNRVTLAGACGVDDVAAHLREAAVFVLPAVRDASGRMDGIPVALMEAMAAGVPVVTTSVSGIPELVTDGETGLLVEPANDVALARAIARLLDDEVLRARVVAAARARVERDFDLYLEAGKVGDLFAESLAAVSN